MATEILLSGIYFLLFAWIIKSWKFFSIEGISSYWITLVFVLKIICGIILQIIYTNYYPNRNEADIYKFFDDSAVLYNSLFNNPKHFFQMLLGINSSADYLQPYYEKMARWHAPFNELFYNEARTMIRLNTLFRFVSFGYYNVHVVFINFLSLVGLTGIFKAFYNSLRDKKKILFIGVFLIPSVLFWSSGLLKESLELFVLGALLYNFHKMVHEQVTAKRVLVQLVFITLHVFIKVYILLALLPGLISHYVAVKTDYKNIGIKFLSIHLIYFLILFNLHFIAPAINIPELVFSQYNKYLRFAEHLHSGSLVVVNEMQPTFISLIKNSFYSFFTVLFRPHLFEAKSLFMLFAAIENAFILFIIGLTIINFKSKKSKDPLFYFSIYFTVIVFTLIGLTTPVLGTVVRYKIPALPFLMFVLITTYNNGRLFKAFSFLKARKVKAVIS